MTTASPEILETAHLAFKHFTEGLATGEWQAFLNMLTSDFTFWFPVGAFKGKNVGKEKAREFFHFVTDKVFTEGLVLTLERVTSSDTTVLFEARSEGKMFGFPYQNQVAISFDIRGDQVCAYREYLSIHYQLQS
ncbi:conserved hypothetical protein [Gloeothece citriformis PCC 7424]|uniref:SnoaL-like domain-containing protein n=1 Tax=Gloeothece citriformis (strain PCC 7424) TaxID=65393 RepID=B7KFJ2_GLOC7|nr:nuclear transport factor 2 family protein [Gloeothece citriformis]ACK73317.1 conserved hypothetical protein [Gloeothece citriformis PCC 7424]